MCKHLLIVIWFFSFNTQSQTLELFCKGSTSGTDIRTDSSEFTMWVSFAPPEFGGIRNFLVPACMEDSKTPNNTPSCKSTSNELDCTCNNSIGTTMINLSRISGKLSIQTFFKDKNNWEGNYYCDKITTKKF